MEMRCTVGTGLSFGLFAAMALLLLTPGLRGFDRVEDLSLGDTLVGTVQTAGADTVSLRFDAVAGTAVSLKVKVAKGSTLVPTVALKDDGGADIPLGESLVTKGSKVSVKKFPIASSGTFRFEIGGSSGGGDFSAKTKGKFPKKELLTGTFPGDAVQTFEVVAGSIIKAKFKADKDSDYQPTIESLTDDGGALTMESLTPKGSSVKFKSAIAETGGTVTLTLGGTGTGGFTGKVKVKAPKSKETIDVSGVSPGTLEGLVADRNGAAVVGATVSIQPGDGMETTGADGSFSTTLNPGDYTVLITAPDGVVVFDDTVSVPSGATATVDFGYVTYDPASDYAGKLTCKQCHAQTFDIFERSGHGYKLSAVVDGKVPTFPFSAIANSLAMVADAGETERIDKAAGDAVVAGNDTQTDNELGTPASWNDVSFIIGGFGWKVRFIDLDGYIVTGSSVQYNLETDGVVAYHNDETNKPYNCGSCHTTGWQSLADNGGVNQDGLPGMHGTFEFPGVECEQCHGPGKTHAGAPSTANIVKDSNSELCGTCHRRDAQHRIAASGGLTRHHEQFDEFIRLRINANGDVIEADGTVIPPETDAATRYSLAAQGKHFEVVGGQGCNGCHNAHATAVYDSMTTELGIKTECITCHAGKARDTGTQMTVGVDGAALECVDCHMPYMAKSAVAMPGGTGNEPLMGDISAHIFKIDLTQTEQFTTDGSLTNPYITPEFACLTCHGGDATVGSTMDLSSFDFSTYTYHQ